MMFRPAMLGLIFFCLGSAICMGASRLPPARYPRYIAMTVGVACVMIGIWLGFFGYHFLF
jgi:hypothetical protein